MVPMLVRDHRIVRVSDRSPHACPAMSPAAQLFAVNLTVGLIVVGLAFALYRWDIRRRFARTDRLVAPEERSDRMMLRMLRDVESGESPRETEISFYLYFATRDAADAAAAEAGTLSIETPTLVVGVEPAGRGANWLCLVRATIVPSESTMRRAAAELSRLAVSHGGEFDGWEAAMPW